MRALIVSHSVHDALVVKLQDRMRALGLTNPFVVGFEGAEKAFFQHDPELVFVCMAVGSEKVFDVIARLRGIVPGKILATGQANNPKLILRAMQSGADYFLDQNELDTELEATLSRFTAKSSNAGPMGRLLSILSASGGCGASTLSVNIATLLAKEHGKCCLIDLNPGRGDLAALLDLKPHFSLADLCVNEARLDRAIFEKMLIRHECGVHLLGSPQQFADARVVTPRGVSQALTWARKLFAEVVVDLEDCFHEEQVLTLTQSVGILLVCRLDFTSLRNARRILDQMQKFEVPRNRVKLVINQHGQPNELPIDEAEDALGEKLTSFVPHDPKTITMANNTGVPAALKEPQSKVMQSMQQLARLSFDKRTGSSPTLPTMPATTMRH